MKTESWWSRVLRLSAYRFAYPFLWLAFVPVYRLRVSGAKHLKESGAAISVMNHCLYLEWFFLCHAAWPRPPRFSMEEANIRRRDVGWANRLMGGFGIPDNHPMAVAPLIRRMLNDGELVHFFPEGYLKLKNQVPTDFRSGAAWFACFHDVPIIPVTEVLLKRPIHLIFPWWPPGIRIVVGSPMLPGNYNEPGESLRNRAQRMTAAIQEIISATITAEGNGFPSGGR